MKKLVLCLTLLLLASCGSENKQSESTEFVLDFSDQKNYVYSYTLSSLSETQRNGDESPNKVKSETNGDLNIEVKKNNVADLSLNNHKTILTTFDKNGVKNDMVTNTAQTIVIQNLNQKGRFENNPKDMMFELIFALPISELKIGETEKIPMQIPYDIDGSKYFVKGFNEIEYTGKKMIDGMECAVLNGQIDISELDIPEELASSHEITSKGKGTYYYNLKDQYFVSAEISINMSMSMSLKTDDPENAPFTNSQNSNQLKIRLKEIVE
ncbi:hypothetical protein [Muriicola soli]|uniref:Lipoprotein n=1 Tax=Muriicola soli TaxID=2507538 RepID=A0A411EA64_9FLAO|nr:hypothetical protein [Muriicola soli]QBA64538.1 hypothetical protein EQY75_08370 [Muriicola soli]